MKQGKLSVGLRDGSPKMRISVWDEKFQNQYVTGLSSNTESLYLKSAFFNTRKESKESRERQCRDITLQVRGLCQYHFGTLHGKITTYLSYGKLLSEAIMDRTARKQREDPHSVA